MNNVTVTFTGDRLGHGPAFVPPVAPNGGPGRASSPVVTSLLGPDARGASFGAVAAWSLREGRGLRRTRGDGLVSPVSERCSDSGGSDSGGLGGGEGVWAGLGSGEFLGVDMLSVVCY